MNNLEIFQTMFNNLGVENIMFYVDYRDDSGNYYNNEHLLPVPVFDKDKSTDLFVARYLIDMCERKGYTVYSIYTIIGGMDIKEVERLAKQNSKSIKKYVKSLYYDGRKEAAFTQQKKR